MTARTCTLSVVGAGGVQRSTLAEVWTALLGVAGGGLGVELVRRWSFRRKQAEQQNAAIELRILDDGAVFRQELMAQNKALGDALAAMTERAHAGELRAALAEAERDRLKVRLERKDECSRALMEQLAGLGVVPCVLAAPSGRDGAG